jgi:hypothetical protein
MNKIVLGYLSDGNFWRGRLYESDLSNDRNSLEYRNPDKLSDWLEIKCGGGKGNTYNPDIPNIYDADRLEVIKTTLESRLGCVVEYHQTASINDYWGANSEEDRKKAGTIPY